MSIRKCLSFDDVLLVPRNSGLGSTSEVDLSKDYCYATHSFEASAPIINSPMDTVCSFSLCNYLHKEGFPVTIHRFFDSARLQRSFYNSCDFKKVSTPNVFLSVGSLSRWKGWIDYLISNNLEEHGYCVDMANGDSRTCLETVEYLRRKQPEVNIMAGNVATKSGFERLYNAGADFIRVGVGSGCFLAGSKVITDNGIKNIEDVKVGDVVKTHKDRFKKVVNTFIFDRNEKILNINDNIKCTKNHEFFVVNKTDAEKVTDKNYLDYGFWIEAEKLNKEKHLLIKLK